MAQWTEELKAQAKEMYVAADPTADNTSEIVAEIAEELGFTPNGVRLVLSKAGVYVTKTPTAKKSDGEAKKTGGTRVNKEAAQEALREAIEAAGKNADMDIISKLTGKAAQYFTGLFKE